MKVSITYFKLTGKYYTTDENVEWPPDTSHYSGWAPFKTLVRIKDMVAVCMETPLGFPHMYSPTRPLPRAAVVGTWVRDCKTGEVGVVFRDPVDGDEVDVSFGQLGDNGPHQKRCRVADLIVLEDAPELTP